MRSLQPPARGHPLLGGLERAHAQQQRPSTAKNKQQRTFIKRKPNEMKGPKYQVGKEEGADQPAELKPRDSETEKFRCSPNRIFPPG